MHCPQCLNASTQVYATKKYDVMIERYRRCLQCGQHFVTYETNQHIRLICNKKDANYVAV
jgi:transcriptional regulator NrdR family protein